MKSLEPQIPQITLIIIFVLNFLSAKSRDNLCMEKELRTHKLIGTVREVHTIIGTGHLEAVYYENLEIEFENRKIPFISKP